MSPREAPFFIGWSSTLAPSLRRFLLLVAALLLGAASGLAMLLGATARDPAGAGFALLPGQTSPAALPGDKALTGVLATAPYPVLHLPPDAQHPRGRPVLLAGDGKTGAPLDMTALAGQRVAAEGYLLQRGSIDMLVLGAPPRPLDGTPALPASEPLGRWRLTGEICDGKCAAGAMRPGTGPSHRACAVLCLDGDIPAVFVTASPVAGSAFLLLAAPNGGTPMPGLRHLVGLRVQLDGALERQGGLLVFRAEPGSAVLP